MKNCKVCNSIINEITIFNGGTKHFCSSDCVETGELIETFRDYIKTKIDKYQYTSKDELIMFLHPPMKKKMINVLISDVINRGYFKKDSKGFIYLIDKIVYLPRDI